MLKARQTSSIHDLFCITCQRCPSSIGIYVKLFSPCSKIFDECSKYTGSDAPSILGGILIKECMHDFDRFIGEPICFGNAFRSDCI